MVGNVGSQEANNSPSYDRWGILGLFSYANGAHFKCYNRKPCFGRGMATYILLRQAYLLQFVSFIIFQVISHSFLVVKLRNTNREWLPLFFLLSAILNSW